MSGARYLHLVLVGLLMIVVLAAVGCTSFATSTAATPSAESYFPVTVKDATPVMSLPDLIITSVSITLENPGCYDGSSMGTRVNLSNAGAGDAGKFVVAIDDVSVDQPGVTAGNSTSVWVSGYSNQPYVVVDATNTVSESNEDNNVFNSLVPIPTLPPPCP